MVQKTTTIPHFDLSSDSATSNPPSPNTRSPAHSVPYCPSCPGGCGEHHVSYPTFPPQYWPVATEFQKAVERAGRIHGDNARALFFHWLKDMHTLYNAKPTLLTLDQAKNLLTIFESAPLGKSLYQFQNMVCAMCIEPWNIPPPLGGCGVKYFGNQGKPVVSDQQAAVIKAQNHKALVSIHRSSFWLDGEVTRETVIDSNA